MTFCLSPGSVLILPLFANYATLRHEMQLLPFLFLLTTAGALEMELTIPAGTSFGNGSRHICLSRNMDWTEPLLILNISLSPEHKTGGILFWGCEQVGRHADPNAVQSIWTTDSMDYTTFAAGDLCQSGLHPVFPGNILMTPNPDKVPHGMGFKVGVGTETRFIAMCVHYHYYQGNATPETTSVHLSLEPESVVREGVKSAARFTLSIGSGVIEPHKVSNITSTFLFREPVILHTSTIAVHAHHMAVRATVRKTDFTGKEELIASLDLRHESKADSPNTDSSATIGPGDSLTLTCEYNNTSPDPVTMGYSGGQENCVLFMMYYVDDGPLLHKGMIFA